MHSFYKSIKNYRTSTQHLTLLEHGIYSQLIDSYYINEGPLCADDAKLMRSHCVRTAEEKEAYKNVITDFFVIDNGHYLHAEIDEAMEEIYSKSEKAKASAEKRWQKNKQNKRSACDKNAIASETHEGRNTDDMRIDATNNQEPITNNQEPINKNTLSATPDSAHVAPEKSQNPNPNPNSNPNLNPNQDQVQNPTPIQKPNRHEYTTSFEMFYAEYPVHESKKKSFDAWRKIKPSVELQARMIHAVRNQLGERELCTKHGVWKPEWKLPVTWLNGRCWEDEVMTEQEVLAKAKSNRQQACQTQPYASPSEAEIKMASFG